MARQPIVSKLEEAALYTVLPDGTVNTDEDAAVFLLNPETYEDSKSNTGWVGNSIPGQSLPVYQWVAGGPRIISFEALVTKDTSYFNSTSGKAAASLLDSLTTKGLSAVGSIASNFLGVPLPAGQIIGALLAGKANQGRFDLDISDTLAYYRSLYTPQYNNTQIVQSPPLLVFYSGLDDGMLTVQDSIDSTSEVFILTNLNIRITKQMDNLYPMEAVVSFQLEQYPLTTVGSENVNTTPVGIVSIL